MAGTRTAPDAALATLDKLNRGVVLLDARGRVGYANRAARMMAGRRDGVRLHRARLFFDDPQAQSTFDLLLGSTGPAARGSVVLRVKGPHTPSAYRVLVSRLDVAGDRGTDDGVGFCVFIYEPNGGQQPVPTTVLRELYGLSAAEARLANELFTGRCLTSAAANCGVRLSTARSVLKTVFAKCEVSSQAELLLLLSLGPRTL